MLKQEQLNKIASLIKMKPEDLKAAIEATEEKEITIDDTLSVLTNTEIDTLKNNEYKAGKEKGTEMLIKDTKEKLGLDFQGKTIDGLLDAHGKKVLADAKIEPEKKVTELTEKITNLQKTVTEQEAKLAEKDNEVSTVKLNTSLYKEVPGNLPLEADEVITLMKAKGYDFKMVDGKTVAFKDGKELQDKLSNAVPVKDVISSFLTEKKLVSDDGGGSGGSGGRGGGDKGGAGKATKLSELKAQFAAEGKSLLGGEFSAAVEAAAKENAEFDMNA